MSKKNNRKEFDCVEMKNRIQEGILARYEKRKKDFDSLAAFIKAESEESPWVQSMIEKIRKAQKSRKRSA